MNKCILYYNTFPLWSAKCETSLKLVKPIQSTTLVPTDITTIKWVVQRQGADDVSSSAITRWTCEALKHNQPT